MLRRSPAFSAALAVALLLVARPSSVLGSGIVSAAYQLTNTNPAGTAPVSQIVTNVIPPGSIVPPPLTILPGSSGFDQTSLQVRLGAGQTPSGSALQALELDFNNGGFAPGGVLNFSLSLDPNATAPPTLQLPTDGTATGLSLVQATVQSTNPGGSNGSGDGSNVAIEGGTPNAVPEPISIVLWCTGAIGLGLIHVRRARRSLLPVG